ncbi:MAG: hypothetical protein HN576_09660 [Bacteriovoracaceae bacterium]|nr:hypothetical protein [Bacteriovoracaceae bacterium]
MSSLKVNRKDLSIVCNVPTSKSYANRLLILGALSPNPFTIKELPPSTDVSTMISCLEIIGLDISHHENSICIHNSFPECESEATELSLETGDGGTTNRFLLALLALGSRPYLMNLKGDMRSRPMKEMELVLSQCQCQVSSNSGDISIQGPLDYKGSIEIDCSKTTQFLTAFKMIEYKCQGVEFHAKNLDTSKAYYELTLNLIDQIKQKSDFITPPDHSSLGYLLAAGLTLGEVHVKNCLGADRYQADSIFLKLIQEMGGSMKIDSDGIKLKPLNTLSPIDIDCGGFPDLVPTLAYLCSNCNGTSKLRNLEALTYKECNRFEEIKILLTLFEVSYDVEGFDLIIHGSAKKCKSKTYHPKPDHRMVMVAYLFMRNNNGGELHEIQHVSKSYGPFFEHFS